MTDHDKPDFRPDRPNSTGGQEDSRQFQEHVPANDASGEDGMEYTVRALKAGLDKLDGLVPVFEPDLRWLEARMEENRQRIRKRFIRDLTLFLCTALLILTTMGAVLFKLPALFCVLQSAVLLVAPAVLIVKERKRVKES